MVIKMTWLLLTCSLFRSIDFARLVQIFYPFSLQTHPHSFPGDFIFRTIRSLKSCNFQLNFLGESPKDCPRDAKPDRYINCCCCIQSEIQSKFCSFFCKYSESNSCTGLRAKVLGCTNAHWPDIHGHYREAKFTQVALMLIVVMMIMVVVRMVVIQFIIFVPL